MSTRLSLLGLAFLLAGAGSYSFPVHAEEGPAPIPMPLHAMTLQLVCRDGAASGEFHPLHARVLNADTWAGAPRSDADARGYSATPRGRGRGKSGGGRGKASGKPPRPQPGQPAEPAATVHVTVEPDGDAATLGVETDAGTVDIRLVELKSGEAKSFLGGLLTAEVLPAATRIAVTPTENDYPSAARAPDGTIWAAYVAYRRGGEIDMEAVKRHDFRTLRTTGNGNRIFLLHFDGKTWSAPMPVTEPLLDLWKPTVSVGGAGRVWVAWSQQVAGNWDIYRRRFDPATKEWTAAERVTSEPGADVNVVSTVDSTGKVWWAWQGRRGKHFQIFLAGGDLKEPVAVTDSPANHWAPAIAADHEGNVYVAWDGYDNGNYDVFLRRYRNGVADPVVPVATLSAYEARPSLAIDRRDRVWIAYEMSGPNWGKDFGRMAPKSARGSGYTALGDEKALAGNGVGIPLYQGRHIVVKCYADGRLQRPAAELNDVLEKMPRPKSFARIAIADDGRLWLVFRHHPIAGGGGETWAEYATSYDGKAWTRPVMLSDSDGILDNRPALAALPSGGVLAVYSSDWRLRGANNDGAAARLPLKTDLYAALLTRSAGVPPASNTAGETPTPQVAAPELVPAIAGVAEVAPVHPREKQDIQQLRDFRATADGKTYMLARGEFHRHTEYTAHRDGDASLEDMWRYSQDVADMDWLGNGDHDNGWGFQYPWWIEQQTMDIYHNPPYFIAPYTYERSVAWPNGHRNVIFTERGIRTLPRGSMKGDEQTGTPDTKMLYAYLHHFHGICASHTSATGMGTDWRDNDPQVEPVVEVYQGDRNNYECLGAPRGLTEKDLTTKIAAHEQIHEKGLIWNALAKGYRLGFESSSDHVSTHTSYAILLVERPSRQAIVEAFKARRCYAATDNIGLVVKCGEHLMGEEFTLAGKPTLDIRILGSAPVTKIDIVRNNRYVYSGQPGKQNVEMQWTDADPSGEPMSYYYVRLQQSDGNLAWSSPMWIHLK